MFVGMDYRRWITGIIVGCYLKKKYYIIGGILLILIGLCIFLYPNLKYWKTIRQPQKVLQQKIVATKSKPDGSGWKQDKIVDYNEDSVAQAEQAEADGNIAMVGQVSMPQARGMLLPVLDGLTNLNAVSGAATMKPGEHMGHGNYALGSHRLANPYLLFTPLDVATVGMDIWMTDVGKVYQYKVYSTKAVYRYDSEVIDDSVAKERGKPVVTLVTCNDYGSEYRRVVQGELISEWNMKDAPKYATDAFRSNFSVMDDFSKWATFWESTLGPGFKRE